MTEDVYGTALLDYQQGNYSEDITTYVNVGGEEEQDALPLPYLFRTYDEMPAIEKMALDMSEGNILDIGAGAGSVFVFKGKYRAVLITYPKEDEKLGMLDTVYLKRFDRN